MHNHQILRRCRPQPIYLNWADTLIPVLEKHPLKQDEPALNALKTVAFEECIEQVLDFQRRAATFEGLPFYAVLKDEDDAELHSSSPDEEVFVSLSPEQVTLVERGYKWYYDSDWRPEIGELLNFRDITALLLEQKWRKNVIYRSAVPTGNSQETLEFLLDEKFRISTIIDLRGEVPSVTSEQQLVAKTLFQRFTYFALEHQSENVYRWRQYVPPDEYFYRYSYDIETRQSERKTVSCSGTRRWFMLNMRSGEIQVEEKLNELVGIFQPLLRVCAAFFRWFRINAQPIKGFRKLMLDFVALLLTGAPAINAVFQLLAKESPPFLIISTWGKDRVGLVVMLLLKMLGVSDESVLADYVASTAGLQIQRRGIYRFLEAQRQGDEANTTMIATARPEVGEFALRFIETVWGSADNYLASIGVSAETRFAVMERMKPRSELHQALEDSLKDPFVEISALLPEDTFQELPPSIPINSDSGDSVNRIAIALKSQRLLHYFKLTYGAGFEKLAEFIELLEADKVFPKNEETTAEQDDRSFYGSTSSALPPEVALNLREVLHHLTEAEREIERNLEGYEHLDYTDRARVDIRLQVEAYAEKNKLMQTSSIAAPQQQVL